MMDKKRKSYDTGSIWRTSWRARQKKIWGKLIKGTLVALVAGIAMATEQAALWLTWPALLYGICVAAACADALLTESPY